MNQHTITAGISGVVPNSSEGSFLVTVNLSAVGAQSKELSFDVVAATADTAAGLALALVASAVKAQDANLALEKALDLLRNAAPIVAGGA